MAHIIALATSQ